METLEMQRQNRTLVDMVEEKLLLYLKDNNYCIGCTVPNEKELASSLGVAQSVIREASLFGGMKRLIGPRNLSEKTLCNLLEIRIMLETGMTYKFFENVNDKYLKELENIVKMESALEYNDYSAIGELNFHSKLYEITGNSTIMEFEQILYLIMDFAKEKFQEHLKPLNKELLKYGKLVSHADLFQLLAARDVEGYKQAID